MHPELLAPVLQIIHRVIKTFLIKQQASNAAEPPLARYPNLAPWLGIKVPDVILLRADRIIE